VFTTLSKDKTRQLYQILNHNYTKSTTNFTTLYTTLESLTENLTKQLYTSCLDMYKKQIFPTKRYNTLQHFLHNLTELRKTITTHYKILKHYTTVNCVQKHCTQPAHNCAQVHTVLHIAHTCKQLHKSAHNLTTVEDNITNLYNFTKNKFTTHSQHFTTLYTTWQTHERYKETLNTLYNFYNKIHILPTLYLHTLKTTLQIFVHKLTEPYKAKRKKEQQQHYKKQKKKLTILQTRHKTRLNLTKLLQLDKIKTNKLHNTFLTHFNTFQNISKTFQHI
jgi:hypothetical protein